MNFKKTGLTLAVEKNMIIKESFISSVGEATTEIRIAAAKWWRHYKMVNSPCRIQGME